MEKQVISFRASESEVEGLRKLQKLGESSLGQVALRIVREALGVQTSVDSSVNVGMGKGIALLVRDEVEERTAYLANAMNEVKSQLENEIDFLKTEVAQVKAALEELQSQAQVKPKPTYKEVQESAIAPETTIENVGLLGAGRPLSKGEMKNKISSIARTLKSQSFKVSETIIKGKILEMYPNSEDWISDDARKEIIKVLLKQSP